MKKTLFALLAVGVAVVVLAHSRTAHAGEPNAMGCIFVADGGNVNNVTTGYNLNNANIQMFTVPTQALLTLQCVRGPCGVTVGDAVTDAGRALYMAANEKITTSTGSSVPNLRRADGGTYNGQVVSLVQMGSATVAELCVFARKGNE